MKYNLLSRKSTFKRLLYIILFISGNGLPVVKAQQPGFFITNGRSINISSFNAEVKKVMKEVGVPGLSLAVIDNGQIAFYNAYGVKQLGTGEKVNGETIFEAASLSKPFLLYVIYKLVDDGKLDLDKPMYQYLPYRPLEHDPRYRLITPRMILHHSSGIENWRWMNNSDTLEILSDPGKKFVYSGEGYNYLAEVVALILKRSNKQYMEEMVFKPLGLHRTYASYSQDGRFPSNYATGHNGLGKEQKKWKNTEPVPSSAINTTAKDYAKLIISIFDGHHLSNDRIRDILEPAIKLKSLDTATYVTYGAGFEVQYSPEDTIVSHAGNNVGYKAYVYYSVVRKNGIVIFTNSDRGRTLIRKLDEMSVNANIIELGSEYREDYPGYVETLLNTYRQKGADSMFLEIENIKRQNAGKIPNSTLTELGLVFLDESKTIARRILEEEIQLYPASVAAYELLGQLNMEQKEFEQAYRNLSRAKELTPSSQDAEIEAEIETCKRRLENKYANTRK
jgi:CubicO group peptidase (beta-lactamase class C family)